MSFEPSAGERVLWQGRPHGIRGFIRPMDIFFLLFTLLIGFLFGSTAAATPNAGLFFLFPVVVFGLLFAGPRLIGILRESAGVSYIVTDRRSLVRNRGRRVELDIANLPHLEHARGAPSAGRPPDRLRGHAPLLALAGPAGHRGRALQNT